VAFEADAEIDNGIGRIRGLVIDKGMAVSIGRLRDCPIFDYKFVLLSHNTIRGAAGGTILIAELLKAKGYLEKYL